MTPGAAIAVLEPSPRMMISVESAEAPEGAEVYLHAGGRGSWIARMAASRRRSTATRSTGSRA